MVKIYHNHIWTPPRLIKIVDFDTWLVDRWIGGSLGRWLEKCMPTRKMIPKKRRQQMDANNRFFLVRNAARRGAARLTFFGVDRRRAAEWPPLRHKLKRYNNIIFFLFDEKSIIASIF